MQRFFRFTSLLRNRPSPTNNIQYPKWNPGASYFSLKVESNKAPTFNISELKQLVIEKKQIPVKLMTNLLGRIDFGHISAEEGSLLLQCCGEFTVDATTKERDKICRRIFECLLECGKHNTDIYQTYIKVCTDNRVGIDVKLLLDNIKCKPDQKLYNCLLENTCQIGNIEEAYSLLETMKNEGFFADENVFNSLALVHAATLGFESAEKILLTMKTARVQITDNTKASILQGVLRRGNPEDLRNFLGKYAFQLDENQLLIVLKELGLGENISWLPEIEVLYDSSTLSREFTNQLRNLCVHLVHMDRAANAMKIVERFMLGTENFGFFVLEEMLHCKQGIDEIIFLAQQTSKYNQYALENLTEIALQHGYTGAAWKLFANLSKLRPHYFWPLLLTAHQQSGELGIIEAVTKMMEMKTRPDQETLEYYVLPFCNLSDPHLLVDKLTNSGLTVKEVLSPLLTVLLGNGETKRAAALCGSYNVSIAGKKLLNLIASSWHSTGDAKSAATILQRLCESSRVENDLVGDFLVKSLERCGDTKDFASFNVLLEGINERKLKMTTSSAEVLGSGVEKKCDRQLSQQIKRNMDVLLDFRLKPEEPYIPHPRDMTLEELECHLTELEEKNMVTRGVLRRLIRHHANAGNDARVEQLAERFSAAGHAGTPGMKSAVMYGFVRGGHLAPALAAYDDLRRADADFFIDHFKILDLGALLAKAGRFAEALEMLREHSKAKIFGGPSLQRNCLELLRACENELEQMEMFNFLIEKGYCKVSNVILGPLVRIHLKSGNLEKAVTVYVSLVEKYKCTPLQLELVKEVVRSNDENLLRKTLDVTVKIHGRTSTEAVLIIALAEEGREKILRKMLTLNKLPLKKELKRRYERLAKEGKAEALNTLARCCDRLPNEVVEVGVIYECLMKVHSRNNDCESALKLYNFMMETEVPATKDLEDQLYHLLKHNNCDLPQNLRLNN